MKVPNYYTTKPQRYNDSYVMNDIIGILSSKIQYINTCCIDLNEAF